MLRTTIAAISGLLLASAVNAQPTMSLRQACFGDAVKHCASTLGARAATAKCMEAHYADLSANCKAAIEAHNEAMKDHPDPADRSAAQPR